MKKEMLGKTLYKTKIEDDNILLLSYIIEEEERKKYIFISEKKKTKKSCYKKDVGVTYFLTRKEAIDYLIKQLQESVTMGEVYLRKTKKLLSMVKNWSK